MGGRGSSSGLTRLGPGSNAPQPQQNSPVPQQTPTPQNTPIVPDAVSVLNSMDDTQLAALVNASKTVQMPNMLSDADDVTQKFIFYAGANAKPMVLDDAAFDQFMSDNGISQSQIMSRSVNPITYRNTDGSTVKLSSDQISGMLKYSRFNYIGGKHGGQLYGAGTYLDMNGGRGTGYGNSKVITGVLNPATAKVITDSQLRTAASSFVKNHPKFAKAVGSFNDDYNSGKNNMSIYAMAMGYNVIKDASSGYHNVIDRSAIVYRKNDR